MSPIMKVQHANETAAAESWSTQYLYSTTNNNAFPTHVSILILVVMTFIALLKGVSLIMKRKKAHKASQYIDQTQVVLSTLLQAFNEGSLLGPAVAAAAAGTSNSRPIDNTVRLP